MKTIYKYPIETKDEQRILMPKGAKILTVQTQNGEPFIWALVDTLKVKEERILFTYGTGNPIYQDDDKQNYIGTYQLRSGVLVFHVFEPTGL